MRDAASQQVEALIEKGLNLEAYAAAQELWGSLETWRLPERAAVAGRLASRLGDSLRGSLLHARCRRQSYLDHDPFAYPVALQSYHHALGPWGARAHFLRLEASGAEKLPREARVRWLGVAARLFVDLRDFPRAEALLHEAQDLQPGHHWTAVDLSALRRAQDRPDDALRAVQEGLEQAPDYTPLIYRRAWLLKQMDRGEEAFQTLEDANRRLQDGAITELLGHHLMERRESARAHDVFESARAFEPLAPLRATKNLEASIVDSRLLSGDLEGAQAHARSLANEACNPYVKRVAEGLREGQRKELDLPFERQNHHTCGPATLANIARFVGHAARHEDIVKDIHWGGTNALSERTWAEAQGFAVRQFRVDASSTKALIDAEIPFTMSTVGVDWGHLQAVIGYDERTDTIIIRDSTVPFRLEMHLERVQEEYGAHGPEGMAFVPAERTDELRSLLLTDDAIFEARFHFLQAMERNDREAAQTAIARAKGAGAEDWFLARMDLQVASEDDNPLQRLAALDRILARWPKQFALLRDRELAALDVEPKAEWYARIEAKLTDKEALVPLGSIYVVEALSDGHRREHIGGLLARLHARSSASERILGALAQFAESAVRPDDAFELYRCATQLSPGSTYYSHRLVQMAQRLGRVEEVLDELRERAELARPKAGEPDEVHASALAGLGRVEESLAVLRASAEARPETASRWIAVAAGLRQAGHAEEARSALSEARVSHWPEANRHRLLAQLDEAAGLRKEAEAHWRSYLALSPLDVVAHEELVRLLKDDAEHPERGREHLVAMTREHPHHLVLSRSLVVEDLSDESRADATLAAHLERFPNDPWGLRAAIRRAGQAGDAEAVRQLEEALEQSAPMLRQSFFFRIRAWLNLGDEERARSLAEEAVCLHGYDDDDFLLALLGPAGRETAPEILKRQWEEVAPKLIETSHDGYGYSQFLNWAATHRSAEELDAFLERATLAKPHVGPPWGLRIERLMREEASEGKALEVVREARLRHPMSLRLVDYEATLLARAGQREDEIALRQEATRLHPLSDEAALDAIHALEAADRDEEAVEALRAAVERMPGSYALRMELAFRYEDRAEGEAAVAQIAETVDRHPAQSHAWKSFDRIATRFGAEEQVLAAFEKHDQLQAARGLYWATKANCWSGPRNQRAAVRLAAIERALELEPRNPDFHDARMVLLSKQGRHEEAHRSPEAAAWGPAGLPITLRGRRAWVRAEEGRTEEAIASWQELVKEAPDYRFAWLGLRERTQGDATHKELHLEAAERLVALSPEDPDDRIALASILEEQGKVEEARAHKVQAARLAPQDVDAQIAHSDLLAEEGRYEEAKACILAVRNQLMNWALPLHLAELAIRAGDREEALAQLAATGTEDGAPWEWLDRLLDKLDEKGWAEGADAVLARVVSEATEPTECADHLARRHVVAKRWPELAALMRDTKERPELWRVAAEGLLNALRMEENDARLRSFVADHREELFAEDSLWSLCGWAYAELGDAPAARTWLADWPQREDPHEAALWNHAYAAMHCTPEHWPEAEQTALAGLQTFPQFDSAHDHVSLLLILRVLRQEWSAAQALLDSHPRNGLTEGHFLQRPRALAALILDLATDKPRKLGPDLKAARALPLKGSFAIRVEPKLLKLLAQVHPTLTTRLASWKARLMPQAAMGVGPRPAP